MTGPEHYREAERLIADVLNLGEQVRRGDLAVVVQLAQVHATLALAAAVAELDVMEGPNGGSGTGREVAHAVAWQRLLTSADVLPDPDGAGR